MLMRLGYSIINSKGLKGDIRIRVRQSARSSKTSLLPSRASAARERERILYEGALKLEN